MCVVTATGSDFTAILRLVLAAIALGNATLLSVPISIETSIGAANSASVVDLFTCCCPLPLAADNADSQAVSSWNSDQAQSSFLSLRVMFMLLVSVLALLV